MRVLLVDNHDSYTYNIYQLLAHRHGVDVDTIVNDDPRWADLDLDAYDAAVISPGPGNPVNASDFGFSGSVLRNPELPVLGVCLGHQGLAAYSGARVTTANEPRHGHISTVKHTGHELFAGVRNPFSGVRYHSLHVEEPLPDELEVLARSEDGLVMAIGHRQKPHWGLQFHPESISSEDGRLLVDNFLRLARAHRRSRVGRHPNVAQATMLMRTIHHEVDTEHIADYLNQIYSQWIWLDSARIVAGTSRYSLLAPAGTDANPIFAHRADRQGAAAFDVLDFLNRQLDRVSLDDATSARLPFQFKGGYIGFLGYEAKLECGYNGAHTSATPDAVWVRCHRFIVVDHVSHNTYVVAISDQTDGEDTDAWIESATDRLRRLTRPGAVALADAPPPVTDCEVEQFARSRSEYTQRVIDAQHELHLGNSYEVCLTNTLHLPVDPRGIDPLAAYLQLRRSNPAPYAAFLKLDDLVVWCSSPEKFLSVSAEGIVESRPIKGTAPRSADPRTDASNRDDLVNNPKTLAENLMIVDLVRNDLGRVCETGTVTVPSYMATEPHPTVHQLVSTIQGELASGHTAIDAIRASFPPGSMTGAPKLRTTDIIDTLETEARGVYSGALGYLSYNGAADLNVVIRTAVGHGGEITIGAGGAIVLDSDPDDEYTEMLLKARALVRIFGPRNDLSNA